VSRFVLVTTRHDFDHNSRSEFATWSSSSCYPSLGKQHYSQSAAGESTPTTHNSLANERQRGNPVLECVRNVGKEFGDIIVDYQVGRTTGVLWLRYTSHTVTILCANNRASLKYHRLHPEYIHTRIEKLGHTYTLRLLLILCDVVRALLLSATPYSQLHTKSEHREPIRELTRICLINNITVIVAFSCVPYPSTFASTAESVYIKRLEEAGHYLATFKQFEFKSPDMIKERTEKDYHSVLRNALTSISKVNKTDVETLRTAFGVRFFSSCHGSRMTDLQDMTLELRRRLTRHY
jgi:DNA excision repair protein ERCC-1